jgi:hypothetical protein
MSIIRIELPVGTAIVASLLIALASPSLAAAEEPSAQQITQDESDKTGTNPVNFARDLRVYNEYSWLNTDEDGGQNVTTLEYRQPMLGGRWQFRSRVRYSALKVDGGGGTPRVEETGLGDADFRLLKKPWFIGANAFTIGAEFFLNTASEDALGSGTTALSPQVYYARFFGKNPIPFYGGGGLFAPGLQYRRSVYEDKGRAETNQVVVDLNFLVMAPSKTRWFFLNPQVVVDRETKTEYALLDVEFGWMMQQWFPDLTGQSFYIRPTVTVGAGSDRPTDYGTEFGYKFVGW